MSIKELDSKISEFVNGASIDDFEALVDLMQKDHPTLQQRKMKLFCIFIEKMAGKEYTDARNDSSKKVAKSMVKGFKVSEIKQYIEEDGDISESLKKYIEDSAVPSKALPLI